MEREQAWISTAPISLAWASVSRLDGASAGLARLRRKLQLALRRVEPEGVERPVLEEDVDRPADRRSAGDQDGRGVQLVIGAGEESDGEGLVHRSSYLNWAASAA
jgi:hypothetical protein